MNLSHLWRSYGVCAAERDGIEGRGRDDRRKRDRSRRCRRRWRRSARHVCWTARHWRNLQDLKMFIEDQKFIGTAILGQLNLCDNFLTRNIFCIKQRNKYDRLFLAFKVEYLTDYLWTDTLKIQTTTFRVKQNEKIFPWKMNYTIKEIALTWTYELES